MWWNIAKNLSLMMLGIILIPILFKFLSIHLEELKGDSFLLNLTLIVWFIYSNCKIHYDIYTIKNK